MTVYHYDKQPLTQKIIHTPYPSQSSGRSAGETQNCLRFESPASLYYSPSTSPPECQSKKAQSLDWAFLALLGALISLAELGIVPSEERNIGCVLKSRPPRRAQGVQTGQRQTVGVVYFGLHCTTLRGVNRRIQNTKNPAH